MRTGIKKLFIGILVANIAVFAVYVFLYSSIRAAQKNIAAASGDLGNESYRSDALRKLENLVEETAEERATLDEYFIPTDGVVSFIEDLEALGMEAGASVEIRTVNIEDAEEGALLERVSVQFLAEGTWESVFNLLARFEFLPRAVRVKSVRFEAIDGAEGAVQWRSIFDIYAWKLRL